jgi:hypothetical protein
MPVAFFSAILDNQLLVYHSRIQGSFQTYDAARMIIKLGLAKSRHAPQSRLLSSLYKA